MCSSSQAQKYLQERKDDLREGDSLAGLTGFALYRKSGPFLWAFTELVQSLSRACLVPLYIVLSFWVSIVILSLHRELHARLDQSPRTGGIDPDVLSRPR